MNTTNVPLNEVSESDIHAQDATAEGDAAQREIETEATYEWSTRMNTPRGWLVTHYCLSNEGYRVKYSNTVVNTEAQAIDAQDRWEKSQPAQKTQPVTWFPTAESDREKLARVTAQRDELLEALKNAATWFSAIKPDAYDTGNVLNMKEHARAVIRNVEKAK